MHVLSDTQPQAFQTPSKIGVIAVVYIAASIGAAGAPTLDTDVSSTGVTIARTSDGLYAITFPGGGRAKVWAGGSIENDDNAPGSGEGHALMDNAIDVGAGTGNIIVVATDDGLVSDPPDGSKLFYKLEVRV